MYDWTDVRVFLAVARAGSTLAAARSLGMNQTTVARRIQALEHALGLALFHRDTRGFHLTDQGEALLAPCERMEGAAESLDAEADRLKRAAGGTIRVTAAEEILTHVISPIIARYRQENGESTFEYVASDRFLDLEKGEADIAFRAADHLDDAALICRRVAELEWAVYCSRCYAKARGAPASFKELAGHAVIAYEGRLATNRANIWFMSQVAGTQVVARSNTVVNMRAILRSNLGLGVLPCFSGETAGDLIRCLVIPVEHVSHIWMLVAPEAHRAGHLRRFMRFAAEGIKEQMKTFEIDGRASARGAHRV